MKILRHEKVVISTTHLDLHNERMTKEALEGMVEQISNKSIPLNWEHNPLLPPIGRVVSALVEPTKDGEYALVGTIEVFDLSSFPTILESGLKTPATISEKISASYPTLGNLDIELQYDPRNYPEETIKTFCLSISGIKIRERQMVRKSVEPTPVIWLTLLAPAVYFFSKGFFTRLGERSADEFISYYKNFRSRLIGLIKSRRKSKPTILVLSLQYNDTKIEGAIQSKDRGTLENALDRLSDLFAISKAFVELNPDVKLKGIQSIFDPDNNTWIFNYLITDSGEIIIGEHLSRKFRGKNV